MFLNPALILIFGGIALPMIPARVRPLFVLLVPLLALGQIWTMPQDKEVLVQVAGFVLQWIYWHPFTLMFATVFALAAFIGGLYGLKQARVTETAAAYAYAGSAIGVTFAGDLITFFIFWEFMAIGSTIVVWCGKQPGIRGAAIRYALMHFVGGVILLNGLIYYMVLTSSSSIADFYLYAKDASEIAYGLILLGVLINAAAPPFSAWLTDAYPKTTVFGMVFLSAFTTKTAVFALLTLFPGEPILIWVGLFMIFYGIILGAMENDMRGMLAYSIINQVGFMVAGAGIGGMALFGAAAHAFCHILYKQLLLTSAGSVLHMTGKSKTSELGGLYRTMKITLVCAIVGALSISAFPLTSGFISKALTAQGAIDGNMQFVWLLILAGTAGVFALTGLKYPWFTFFNRDSGLRPKEPPYNMRLAMVILVILCIAPGIMPSLVYNLLPTTFEQHPELIAQLATYEPNTIAHIFTQLQLLLFAGLAFFLLLPMLKRSESIVLNFDWFYRIGLMQALLWLEKVYNSVINWVTGGALLLTRESYEFIYRLHGKNGLIARNWGIANTVLYATALLGILLIVYYLED